MEELQERIRLVNRTAANLAKERDGNRCILTSTSQPEACHVVPFSISNTEEQRALTETICSYILPCLVGLDDLKVAEDAIHGKVKAYDEAWNILSLSPQLHRWWTQGRWCFKFEGFIPTGQVSPDGQELVKVRLIFSWITMKGKQPHLPAVPSVELVTQMLNTSDWLWLALAGSGWLWLALARSGKVWQGLIDSGWPWLALNGSGRLWQGLKRSGRSG
ncbi:hypothetical protein CDD81_6820 [Ophiocordyceps australis]|uniref:HNH nuclease domain-containing protein n=1 Tax=Ophiocordyceps australis TaxID=1399860 RepID=A0A2C5Y6U1_9HYPO|nr:hypothetical protein CDD81_6820 [Ophiocordyceps australis]